MPGTVWSHGFGFSFHAFSLSPCGSTLDDGFRGLYDTIHLLSRPFEPAFQSLLALVEVVDPLLELRGHGCDYAGHLRGPETQSWGAS